MASASNMEPSLAEKKFNTPPLSHHSLSDTTGSQETPLPSCSSGRPASSNDSPSTPSDWKLFAIKSLNAKILTSLWQKIMYNVVCGRPSETLLDYRRQLAKEVVCMLDAHVPNDCSSVYRDQLMKLLAQHHVEDTPLEQTEWIKLLNQWVRNYSVSEIVLSRTMFKILAVDGIYGFGPYDLKYYLFTVLLPLGPRYKLHYKGIRAMYDVFDMNSTLTSLTGTHSACAILLALLGLYTLAFSDRELRRQIEKIKIGVNSILEEDSDYYRDVNNVDKENLELGRVYLGQFGDNDSWKGVGKELLKRSRVPKRSRV